MSHSDVFGASNVVEPYIAQISAGLVALAASAVLLATPTSAEVRFGNNVRIGGHDFSNQTFNSKRRAVIRLYDHTPRNAGCVWRSDRRGGKVNVCNLRRLGR